MSITIIVIYTIAITLLFFYCIMQLSLAIHYIRYKRRMEAEEATFKGPESEYPMVTVQLPVYNELYVVERLIDAVAAFDYPKDKLEIQLLDDSTDESFEIARKKVDFYKQQGINIVQVKRPIRKGFKAGALEYGLQTAKGEYVAIFDADFVPYPDFLKKTIPYFLTDEKIGVVQARWEHINKDYSILTKMQAFALDMHFTIEQQGRNAAGYFINFNGTAGIWRRTAIDDAGGWNSDTLTEDLDLSYRAQLKGWKFKYVEDVVAPAELPTDMNALKSQQFRWNKGGAETARKIGRRVMGAELPIRIKLHAIAHLFNTTNYIFILITAILSVPLLFIKNHYIDFNYFKYASIFLMGSIAIAYAYYISTLQREKTVGQTVKVYISRFPVFLAITMGMSLHNAWAVFRGWLGQQTAFVRTPKFAINNSGDIWKKKKYVASRVSPITYLEGIFSLYFLSGIIMGIYYQDYGLLPFHIMAFMGFALIFYFSFKHARSN
ncbi:MAG TPA: glycosyltransferase [Chitinophagales bacterium]|nr:glycosyltransferase [Chitinophagales bacterium]HMU68816.1 glycosyltransferase [Chitinophagales bacterium]HMX03206.1 glycosyltransferase [Chitinophagales bacterium]HMZ88294.1 glycosyltransferase [Chitinophagales bacterium]HNA56587.1 glycosyltransferase [Chitinophagales bacterium]